MSLRCPVKRWWPWIRCAWGCTRWGVVSVPVLALRALWFGCTKLLGGGRTRTPAGSLPMIATNAPCGGGLYTGAPGLGGTDPPAGGALRGGGGAAEDAAGGPFGGVTGCCAPGAPAAAPLGAGRTRPTGGGGSMRSAAALGSVFSGSSTSPSSGVKTQR